MINVKGGIYKGSLNIGVQVDKTVHVLSVNGTAIFQCANPTSDTGIELTYNGMVCFSMLATSLYMTEV